MEGVRPDPADPRPEIAIRAFTVSLVGVVALAAGLVLLKQPRPGRSGGEIPATPPGERIPEEDLVEKLRMAGI